MRSLVKNTRPLDHLVLPTADLDTARARLTALGFTVSPNGVHPFGTENCCVYFADGAFLEPLEIRDEAAAVKAVAAGNVFVARDAAYRSLHGEEGFSALVIGTSDAKADDARFRRSGFSAGEMLAFSRPFVNAQGLKDTASFLLAFAADPAARSAFFFTCQRVNAPKVDRRALESHANGARGISQVVLSASEPQKSAGLLRELIGRESNASSDGGLAFHTANAIVSVVTPNVLKAVYGIDAGGEQDLRLRSITFFVADLRAADALLARNGIARELQDQRIAVAPTAGQGAHFIFEAAK